MPSPARGRRLDAVPGPFTPRTPRVVAAPRLPRPGPDRLTATVRDMDTVARLGGDEFAILLPAVGAVEDAEQLGRRVLEVFEEPFDLTDLALHVDASIGVVVLPDHADDFS